MKNLNLIAKLPEVTALVLADLSGALLDASGDVDGEAVGAVHAFSTRALSQAGELLGLGAFQRASIASPTKACIITVEDDSVLGVYVDPTKPLAVIEKKIDESLRK